MRRVVAVTGIAAVLASCATAMPMGPTTGEFSALVPDHVVRQVDCAFIAEEGSEWICRYQRWTAQGRWEPREAVLARDGARWVLIDG